MSLKHEHCNRLRLLALESITEIGLKELLKYLICNQEILLDDGSFLKTSANENKALSQLFKEGKQYLNELTMVSNPETQRLIFTDKKMIEVRDEILIRKLDVSAVLDIIRRFPLIPSYLQKNSQMQEILDEMHYIHVVTLTNVAETFWQGLTTTAGDRKSQLAWKYPRFACKDWKEIWSQAKSNVLKLLSYLKDRKAFGASASDGAPCNQYKNLLNDIQLISTWSKSELLQSYSSQIGSQLKASQYLSSSNQLFLDQKEVSISIRVNDITYSPNDKGYVTSVISYIKSFIWYPAQDLKSKSYGLDESTTRRIEEWFKRYLAHTFDEQVPVTCRLNHIRLALETEDVASVSFIPLKISIRLDVADVTRIFKDVHSGLAKSLWSELKHQIVTCVSRTTNADIDIIRTSWEAGDESGEISACVFKRDECPWVRQECYAILRSLNRWKIPGKKIKIEVNIDVVEKNTATFNFKLTSACHEYFTLLEHVSKIWNDFCRNNTLYVSEKHIGFGILHNEFLEQLKYLGKSIAESKKIDSAEKPASPSSQPSDDSADSNKLLSAIHEESRQKQQKQQRKTSIPRRKSSASSTYIVSPRITPRTNGISPRPTSSSTPQSPTSISREGSFIKTNNESGPFGTSPREARNGKITKLNIATKDDASSDESNCIADNGWIKMIIAVEYILKPALLEVLHNDKKQATIKGLPKNPTELYSCISNMKSKKPRTFERWTKEDMQLLLPDSGTNKVDSKQLDVDMIFFLIKCGNVIQPPNNGWNHPKAPTTGQDAIPFYCWEAVNIKHAILMARTGKTNMAETSQLMQRLENVVHNLQYKSSILKKLKENDLDSLFFANVIF